MWVTLRSQHLRPRSQTLQAMLSNPHSLGEEEKETRKRKEKEDKGPVSRAPHGWSQGQQRVAAGARPSSGRGGRAGFLLPRHGDGSVAVARIPSRCDLGTREGQHAVGRQGAGESRLVHVGRQAVAAVELAGDVAMVVLGGRGGHRQGGHQPLPRGQQPHREKGLLDSTRVKPMASPRQSGEAGLLLRSAYPHPIPSIPPTPISSTPASLHNGPACPGPSLPRSWL